MNERPDDEPRADDWFAAQFAKAEADAAQGAPDATRTPDAGVPDAGTAAPVTPASAAPGIVPGAGPFVNPFGVSPVNPYTQPLVIVPQPGAAQPGIAQPGAAPPAAPQATTPPQQPAPQQPVNPPEFARPVPQQPVAEQPPMQQPAMQQPVAQQTAQPAAEQSARPAFAWGLTPGATTPPVQEPVVAPPAVTTPPATATTPPAAMPSPFAAPAPVPPALVEPPPTEVAPLPSWGAPASATPAPASGAPVSTTTTPAPATPTSPFAPAPTTPPVATTPPTWVTPSWDEPTQAHDFGTELAQGAPASAPLVYAPPIDDGITAAELLGATVGPAAGATEVLGTSGPDAATPDNTALDSLFGEQQFRDYDAEPTPLIPPVNRTRSVDPATISKQQKIALWVAGGLVGVLALVALFLLGTRLPEMLAPAPKPTPQASTPAPTPTPLPTALPAGPVEPGEWAWDELLGGECLAEYSNPWAEEFTVVDCAEPHPAQMVVRGLFPPSAEGVTDDPYPGAEALQGQLALLCSAPGVIDLAVAGQYPDVQFQGAYPATAEQWDAGDRSYYCFVSRSSGEPLTGSVAVPPAAPAA